MLDFMKKAGKTFCLNVAATVLAFAGWILYLVTNSTPGYAIMGGSMGMVLGIIAVLLIAGSTFTSMKFGSQHYITAVLGLVSLALLMVVFGVLLSDRAVLASALFTWNGHNTLGWSVFYTSVASAAFLLVAVILLIVNAFIDNKE